MSNITKPIDLNKEADNISQAISTHQEPKEDNEDLTETIENLIKSSTADKST